MKTSYIFFLIVLTTIIAPLSAQPSWTELTYTDWSPDSTAAITGDRAYDSATVWDGERFVTFFQGTEGEPYLTAASDNGRDWSYLNGGSPISVANLFSHGMGNHTVACDPDGFPSEDVLWVTESENVRFKMWYADTSTGEYFQYAESTGGINWNAFSEGEYCPPYYKIDPNQYMTKPSVLYHPDGLTDLSTDNPMDNRYLMYLNSAPDLDPYYYELYISSNGLDWTLYAWDSYCESRFSSETIFEEVTFSDYTGEPDYVDTFEEVFTYGVRNGWMLWTHNGDTGPIASWYSINGYDWIFREEPINEIGEMNGETGYWNENANINLDSVRLGNNYFFLRSGMTNSSSTKFQLGAGIKKGMLSADIDELPTQVWGNVSVTYHLYSWNNQTCPHIETYFSIVSSFWPDATQGSGGDGKENLTAGIGGTSHTFVWNSLADFPMGWHYVKFRLIPLVYLEPKVEGEYDTTGPFSVNLPSPTPTPEGYMTPSPTPSAPPTPSTTPTPQPTSTTSPTPEDYKSPTPTPTPTLIPTPSLTPTPTATPTLSVTPTPSVTPTSTVTPTPNYCASPLLISDLEGLWLAHPRAKIVDGWYYQVVKADSLTEVYGEVYDNANSFTDQSSYPVYPAALRITRVNEDFNIQTGDYIELTYDSLQTIYVYPPPLSGNIDVYYYIGLDGSTYNDLELCIAAKIVPTPTATPTATPEGYKTPTPSPSSTSTPTSSPTITPTPTPTPTSTPAPTASPTPSPKKTPTITPTPVKTPSPSPSPPSNSPPWIYDYDGDGTSDIGIFRGSSGLWAIRSITRIYFGNSTDKTVPGDYDGDGTTDIAIFRPSSGLWAIRGVSRIYFGGSSDVPVQGDYNGNGTWSEGIFRPSSGLWAIRYLTRSYFGGSSDEPVSGYYAGGLLRKIGIFRPASGLWAIRGVTRIYFGGSADETVPGGYDGTGTWSTGIFRPAAGLWAIRSLTRAYFGGSADIPIPGDYSGSGEDDIGIFRPASGLWAIRGVTRAYFGGSSDLPVSR